MREILFRGKSKSLNKGKWVYGSFVEDKDLNACCIRDNSLVYELVERETVGQFTGVYDDKSGKKIFEGDIVQGTIVSAWNKALIRCEVVYNKDGFISVERTRNQDLVHKVKFAKDIEVIGNIHDNPELIGERK